MAIVGCLGDIAFFASSELTRTISNMKLSGSAKYSTHQVHGGKALPELTGQDADKLTFDVVLSIYLGVSPKDSIKRIREAKENGEALPFVLGNTVYGDYRWVITSYSVNPEHYSRLGGLNHVKLSLTLQEYPKS
jgi:hypothetical protein